MSEKAALEGFYEALLLDDPVELYDRAPCGYLSTSPDGLIAAVNQTFLALTGYEREELVGRRSFVELLAPGGRIYHETHYAPLLRMQGSVREIALEIVRPDGSRLPVLVNSVLELDEAGAERVVRTAVFDATERRSYERELLRSTEMAREAEHRAEALARTLQQTLIPPRQPSIPGLEIGTVFRPMGEGTDVGGDFYDVFPTGRGDFVVVVGDVTGKGVDAAVLTALARYTLRGALVGTESPAEALRALNEVLINEGGERYCTAAVVLLRPDPTEPATVLARLSVAGHPPPLLHDPRGSMPSRAVAGTGRLLGAFPEVSLEDTEMRLSGGATLLLYTDGVTEARIDGNLYGEEELCLAFARHSAADAQTLAESVVAGALAFEGGRSRDDIAVVVLRVPWPAGSTTAVRLPASPQ